METKYLIKSPSTGRARVYKKMKVSKTIVQLSKADDHLKVENNTPVIKKQWKKPVLLCGKKISLFELQSGFPPDDFS
jgi:hypothetical protein